MRNTPETSAGETIYSQLHSIISYLPVRPVSDKDPISFRARKGQKSLCTTALHSLSTLVKCCFQTCMRFDDSYLGRHQTAVAVFR